MYWLVHRMLPCAGKGWCSANGFEESVRRLADDGYRRIPWRGFWSHRTRPILHGAMHLFAEGGAPDVFEGQPVRKRIGENMGCDLNRSSTRRASASRTTIAGICCDHDGSEAGRRFETTSQGASQRSDLGAIWLIHGTSASRAQDKDLWCGGPSEHEPQLDQVSVHARTRTDNLIDLRADSALRLAIQLMSHTLALSFCAGRPDGHSWGRVEPSDNSRVGR